MKKKIFTMFDYFLILLVSLLILFGILFIYSSNINSNGVLVSNEHSKQIIWAVVSFIVMIIFTIMDYRRFENMSRFLYALAIFLLIIVLIPKIGIKVKGARSWLGIGSIRFQPAEICKILFTLYLAQYLDNSRDEQPLKRFIIATVIMGVPVGLILLQSDLGSATVYIPVYLVMCLFAGIPIKMIVYVLSLGLLSIFYSCLPLWNIHIAKNPVKIISLLTITKYRVILIFASGLITLIGVIVRKYFHGPKWAYWVTYVFSIISISLIASYILSKVLKDHQIWRLIIFMDPSVSPDKYGWNIIQSKIAIGAGGLFGKSYLHGTQSHGRFLPEQSTDFIFSILSEEWGFFGGILVFLIYTVILLRILYIIKHTNSNYGVYVASGILSIFAYHFFINIGTVMGITPVIGIPMFFMSYGGSSLLTGMICIGIIQSINCRRKELN